MKLTSQILAATVVLFASAPLSVARAAEPETSAGPATFERALTEAEVAALAAHQAPSVMAAESDAKAAAAEHAAAERSRLPDLVVSARYTRLSSMPARYRTLSLPSPDGSNASLTIPELLDNFAARAAIVVPLSEAWLSLAASARARGQLATAKNIELEATRARLTYEARSAFLLHRRALVALRVSQSALEVASAQAKDQENRVNAGTAPGSSVLTFEAARHAAVARQHLAEAEVIATRAAVGALLPPALANLPFNIDDDVSSEGFRDRAEGSPALRAAEAAVRAADTSADAERLAMLPRISLVGGVDVGAPNPRAFAVSRLEAVPSWDVTVQLDWSLSALTVGSARHERALAEREALRARAEEVRRTLESQRRSAIAARASARARMAAGQLAVLTANQLAAARRNELAAGLATPLDVTNAEAERVRAELEAADAELDLRLANAQLDYTAGYVAPQVRGRLPPAKAAVPEQKTRGGGPSEDLSGEVRSALITTRDTGTRDVAR